MITGPSHDYPSRSKGQPDRNNAGHQDPETLLDELSEIEIQRAVRKRTTTAEKLARNAPQAHRKEMEKLFNIGLYVHERFEQIHKLPRRDINGALAIFLYGIWSTYNPGHRIPGPSFPRLITSSHEILAKWGDFLETYERSAAGKRQSLYETFAMVGNWLLMIQHHLSAQPDDTALNNVKIMVREIIVRSLKIEPECIIIGQDGHLMLIPLTHSQEISA
ncbi:MAG: DUF6683 family protein [Candidatus Thiodiazotropha sp.]